MIHSMKKMRGKTGFFAIKVDLAKAYDMIRWSFILDVLLVIGIPHKMIHVIMHCITSIKTNVLCNGGARRFSLLEEVSGKRTLCLLIFLLYVWIN